MHRVSGNHVKKQRFLIQKKPTRTRHGDDGYSISRNKVQSHEIFILLHTLLNFCNNPIQRQSTHSPATVSTSKVDIPKEGIKRINDRKLISHHYNIPYIFEITTFK